MKKSALFILLLWVASLASAQKFARNTAEASSTSYWDKSSNV